jgi:hypothetical protein
MVSAMPMLLWSTVREIFMQVFFAIQFYTLLSIHILTFHNLNGDSYQPHQKHTPYAEVYFFNLLFYLFPLRAN